MYGNQEAVELWNDFYDHVRSQHDLAPKAALEGMSRGGLIVYNWAAQNTDKVASIYADAPVCDIKSWPGGLFQGKGSEQAWKTCLKAHQLDQKSVLNYQGIPLFTCMAVAKAGIPVLHVYGDADEVVPHKENTRLLAKRFRKAGGKIKLIRKKGIGHHPHSLKDPAPIVDFIMKFREK
jgi:pimeloyl-ACP methyl ester carboxylesterase